MLKRFGIKGKLLLLCGSLTLFTVGIGTVSVLSLRSVSAKYDQVANNDLPNIQCVGRMQLSFRKIQAAVLMLAVSGVTDEMVEESMKTLEASRKDYLDATKLYLSVPFSPGAEEIFKRVEASWTSLNKSFDHGIAAFRAKDSAKLSQILLIDIREGANGFRKSSAELLAFDDASAKGSVSAAQAIAAKSNLLAIALVLISLATMMSLGYFFSRSLSKTLHEIAMSLSGGATEVAAASSAIASSSEELSAAVTEQAAALQETAASIEEMSAMVTKNTENCSKSSELSSDSQTAATRGKKIVGQMITAIQEINTSNGEMALEIEKSNLEISNIIKVIAEIGNKTKVINDIVFQTKLLSFNASVEAARAGEHGKGFAVVAEEVGNLAQMSGNASREISGMLDASISQVEAIVNNMKTNVERAVANGRTKVETGAGIAAQCGEVLDSIVGSVVQVNTTVDEIAIASKEQDHGVREVAKAMAQLDQVTQQNSSASQQTATSAEQLSAQAAILRSSVSRLMNAVQGEGSEPVRLAVKSPAPVNRVKAALARQGAKAPVIPISRAVRKEVASTPKSEPTKMLGTGTSGAIPSSDDSRFEDV
ncbi:MAG: MCP four helix bundle domain-containing protein [Cryobacterium sp.]|nr:MCP four helix bundle domain-containing protein [Oligoflexia bacterium]